MELIYAPHKLVIYGRKKRKAASQIQLIFYWSIVKSMEYFFVQ